MAEHSFKPEQKTFKRNGHINYFLRCLRALPTQAQDNDSNRSVISRLRNVTTDLQDYHSILLSFWVRLAWSIGRENYKRTEGWVDRMDLETSV